MTRRLPSLALAAALAGCGGYSSPGGPSTAPPAGSPPVVAVQSEGWAHVPEGSPVTYAANPPASGPHYPVWARYIEHTQTIARPYWVHNLEHGAVVLLYRPDAPAAAVDTLRNAYRTMPADPSCGHTRALMTADPLLPRPVAAVAADNLLMADHLETAWVHAFVQNYRGRGPEAVCTDGSRP